MTPPAPAPDPAVAQRQTLIFGVLLLCALALAYLPALRGEFIWDDDAHVTANPCIVGPLGLAEIWTTPAANYFPLVLTNFWVQHALWGLDPLPYHAVTLAFHMGNALLLWAVLRRLRIAGAWLGAALWALHPVQVESVAWISELKNTQSGFFFLLSVFFFVGSLRSNESSANNSAVRRDYLLALACGVLAILSKPSAVMLPVALALLAWWDRGKMTSRDLIRLAPLFGFAAIAGGWAIWEQRYHQGAIGAEWSQTWPERLIIAGRVPFFYLGKLLYPEPLSFIYPRWKLDARSVVAFLPLIALVGGLALVCYRAARARSLALVALYFVALLFPVLGLFDVYFFRYSYVSDHFQYLAAMAPLALVGTMVTRLGVRYSAAKITLPLLLVVLLGVLSRRETAKYANDEALWRSTLAVDSRCWIAQNNLGNLLAARGDYAAALAAYQLAVEANPDYPEARNNLGTELSAAGRFADAITHFNHALELTPDDPEIHNNLGNALRCLDRTAEAIAQLEIALRLRPAFFEAHANLARAFVAAQRPAEAIPHFQRALEIQPSTADLHAELAVVLRALGRTSEAVDHADEALKLRAAATNSKRPGPRTPRP